MIASTSSFELHHTYRGARGGALEGMKVGVTLTVAVYTLAALFFGFESRHRALGGEPKFPLLSGDCVSPQFQGARLCTVTPPSAIDVAIYTIGVTLLIGVFLGALRGAIKDLAEFGRSK